MTKRQADIANAGLWVWLFDVHYPKIDRPTWNAVKEFITKNAANITGIGFGGDQHDNEEISHHNKRKIVFRTTGSYKRNTENFKHEVLDFINGIAAKHKMKKVWIIGNHDDWENQLVEEQPELKDTIERAVIYDLAKTGWIVVNRGEEFKLGKLSTIHGETLTGLGNQGSTYHAKKAVESYGTSVLYGHLHALQTFTKISPFAKSEKHVGWCSPILGDTNPAYLRNKPTAWLNGFTLVEVRDTGDFNVYPVVITKGKFTFAGETYGSK